MIDLDTKIRWA